MRYKGGRLRHIRNNFVLFASWRHSGYYWGYYGVYMYMYISINLYHVYVSTRARTRVCVFHITVWQRLVRKWRREITSFSHSFAIWFDDNTLQTREITYSWRQSSLAALCDITIKSSFSYIILSYNVILRDTFLIHDNHSFLSFFFTFPPHTVSLFLNTINTITSYALVSTLKYIYGVRLRIFLGVIQQRPWGK